MLANHEEEKNDEEFGQEYAALLHSGLHLQLPTAQARKRYLGR